VERMEKEYLEKLREIENFKLEHQKKALEIEEQIKSQM